MKKTEKTTEKKKLKLSKETLRRLDPNSLTEVHGGMKKVSVSETGLACYCCVDA
jgi:hypothetical protein